MFYICLAMLNLNGISLSFGKQILFQNVNLSFTPGNCYGVIGANGAGKSTLLKIISEQVESSTGSISRDPKSRLTVLEQDQNKFDEFTVLETVFSGYPKLFQLMKERDKLYSLAEMTEEQGLKAADLEIEFGEVGGYESESQAQSLLNSLSLQSELHEKKMSELDSKQKVKVLLAQAVFGNPDILILDEPTNNLDIKSIRWLEDFLTQFENTVIVVSHDRHFINHICTHITDIDFKQVRTFVGNYDFWYQMSQLQQKQLKDEHKRKTDKSEDLKKFIQRFSSNASKAKQATSRKKLLEKIVIEDIPRTSRKFPYIAFQSTKDLGKTIFQAENLTCQVNEKIGIKQFSMNLNPKDKVAFVGEFDTLKTAFFDVITKQKKATKGTFKWGETVQFGYFPKNHHDLFDCDLSILDWLRQFTEVEDESFVRGFLGRMLFSGEESLKKVSVLSGGEKVRCLLSKLMLSGCNTLILDEPTAHLDLEAITALNEGLVKFNGVILFNSQDYEFTNTIANRIVHFTPDLIKDQQCSFEEFVAQSPDF